MDVAEDAEGALDPRVQVKFSFPREENSFSHVVLFFDRKLSGARFIRDL